MADILNTIANAFKSGLANIMQYNVEEFPREDLDRLFVVREDMNFSDKVKIVDELWEFLERLRKQQYWSLKGLDHIKEQIASASPRVAWQMFQIAAGDLEASDDPNDVSVVRSVLTTDGTQDSDYQFNWMRAGGLHGYKVVLSPNDGSASHPVIIDRDDVNMGMNKMVASGDASYQLAGNVCRPYGMGGLKLQFGHYEPESGSFVFYPSSVAVGSWIYLEQTLSMYEVP